MFAALACVALAAFLRVQLLWVPSPSMVPTLKVGDHVIASDLRYGVRAFDAFLVRWATPKAGDVVVFKAPPWVPVNAGTSWVKRVLAGPGERVALTSAQHVGLTCGARDCVVDDGYLYVVGDNPSNSLDSRFWGAVPIDNVEGTPLLVWMGATADRALTVPL